MHDGSVSAPGPRWGEKRFRTAEHVVSTQQADRTILLDVRGGRYYTLNEVGGRVWALLSEGATVSAVTERLASEFEVSAEQLSGDVEGFVKLLDRSRLITGRSS
jgi:hypothetical protein